MLIKRLFTKIKLAPIRRSVKDSKLICADINRWCSFYKIDDSDPCVVLIASYKEFVNLLEYRLLKDGKRFSAFYVRHTFKKLDTLYLCSDEIGPGFLIQHGFSTIVAAKKIGANCHVAQQVTIGFKNGGNPVFGDDCEVHCGAKCFGEIQIGSGTIIGANAVVDKSIPPNCVVVGIPGRIIKQNGARCD